MLGIDLMVNYGKQENGEYFPTEWLSVLVARGAEYLINDGLAEGDYVVVVGDQQQQSYVAKDGTTKFKFSIFASSILPMVKSGIMPRTEKVDLPDRDGQGDDNVPF